MSFVGHSSVSIDQKRRIAIPAKYRAELAQCCANKLVCTLGYGADCLRLFPRPQWNALEGDISTGLLRPGDDDELARILMAMAEDVYVDSNHRLLLPQHLVDRVGLGKKVYLIGLGTHFEIWDDESWQAKVEAGLALLGTPK